MPQSKLAKTSIASLRQSSLRDKNLHQYSPHNLCVVYLTVSCATCSNAYKRIYSVAGLVFGSDETGDKNECARAKRPTRLLMTLLVSSHVGYRDYYSYLKSKLVSLIFFLFLLSILCSFHFLPRMVQFRCA